MKTSNGDFIEKTLPSADQITLDISVKGVPSTATLATILNKAPAHTTRRFAAQLFNTSGTTCSIDVLQNDFGGTVVLTTNGAGLYTITWTGATETIIANTVFITNKQPFVGVSLTCYFLITAYPVPTLSFEVRNVADGLLAPAQLNGVFFTFETVR